MLKNYIKTAARNIARSKAFSLINILGLAIGMACAILTSLFVMDELSYEGFHKNRDRIYRIVSDDYVGTAAPYATALKQNLPEVAETVRIDNFTRFSRVLFSSGDEKKRFYEKRFVLAEASIFKIFTFPFTAGDGATALNNPNSIILTETTAAKYFGDENPLGKVLHLENRWDFTVTGVIKDIPDNTHLKFDLMAPFSFNEKKERYGPKIYRSWQYANFLTYFMLKEGVKPVGLEKKVREIYRNSTGQDKDYFIQPIKQVHLQSHLHAELENNSSTAIVLFFSLIGMIVLLIACINSMNLSTARAAKRSREVGMRKVVGARRSQLIGQFFGESFLISFFALIAAILLVEVLLPAFNALTGKGLSLVKSPSSLFFVLILTTIITGLGSGIYPALMLSAFKPSRVLQSAKLSGSGGTAFRKVLVVLQFSLAIIFLVATFVIRDQLNFMKNTNLGLNKEQVVNIPLYKEAQNKYESIKNDIKRRPGVISTAASNYISLDPRHHGLWWQGMNEKEDKSMYWFAVDHDFIRTMGMEIIEGRDFSRNFPADISTAYIFNEAAVKELGGDFIKGRKFSLFGSEAAGPVIGIVKDFNFRSLHEKIQPLALCIRPNSLKYISVRFKGVKTSAVLSSIREVWQSYFPNRPFEYSFLDDVFGDLYKTEERVGKTFSYFAFLAIFISCLGLFALASFMAEQRTKEIGVRKVLGASVRNITFLLSKEFTKWVLLANLFAWPVAFIVMNNWLRNFAYKTTMGIEIFIFSGLLALFIALATVSYQSIKAALANPVEALRYE